MDVVEIDVDTGLHCPRAGPGQGRPTFTGPWPWPSRVGPKQLARGPGPARPGATRVGPGSGQGRPGATTLVFAFLLTGLPQPEMDLVSITSTSPASATFPSTPALPFGFPSSRLMDRKPLPTWVHPKGRLICLGDACHPMVVRMPVSPRTRWHVLTDPLSDSLTVLKARRSQSKTRWSSARYTRTSCHSHKSPQAPMAPPSSGLAPGAGRRGSSNNISTTPAPDVGLIGRPIVPIARPSMSRTTTPPSVQCAGAVRGVHL